MTASLEDYRVELDYYAGPLDLLLHLVKKHEIDLHDIPIAQLADQYLHHIEQMKQFDINVAADFLVMAATLLEIKARMIAPPPVAGEGEEGEDGVVADTGGLDTVDPRYELVQQLLEYKRFKDAANELDDRLHDWSTRFPHRPARAPKADGTGGDDADEADAEAEAIEIDLEDVDLNDLCAAFARILESIGQGKFVHAVTYDDTPISLHADDIVDRLAREGAMSLQQIFVGRASRSEMIGLFLATLELVRQKRIRVKQDRPGGDISLELRPDDEQTQGPDDQPTDWRDPETGQMQYEWPDEASKDRFERRKQRSLQRARGDFSGDEEEEAYIELEPVELEFSEPPPDETPEEGDRPNTSK